MLGQNGVLDAQAELLDVNGLGKEIVGAGLDALQPVGALMEGRRQQNGNGCGQRPLLRSHMTGDLTAP